MRQPRLWEGGPIAHRVVVGMALAKPSTEEAQALRGWLADPSLSEAEVTRLVEHNRLSPMAHRSLKALGSEWGAAALRAAWAEGAASVAKTNLERAQLALPIFERLAEQGIPVILLKGNRLAWPLYGALGYKRMNDVDLLVPVESVPQVVATYLEFGCVPLGKIKAHDDTQRAFSHHTPPFFDPSLRLALGTHWDLVTPFAGFRFDLAGFWARKEPVPFPDLDTQLCFGMAPEDDLHHLLVHLPRYKTGMRELMDPINLVRHHAERLDWEAFLAAVRAAGTAKRVLPALILMDAILPLPGVPEAIAALRPGTSGGRLREAELLRRHPERLLIRRSLLMAEVEKAYVRFDAAGPVGEKWRRWLRMWALGLFPSREDRWRVMAWDPQDWRIAWASPLVFLRVIGHIAEDLGPRVFGLLLLKMKWDLGRAAWASLTGRPKPDQLHGVALALGLPPEAMDAAMERLE